MNVVDIFPYGAHDVDAVPPAPSALTWSSTEKVAQITLSNSDHTATSSAGDPDGVRTDVGFAAQKVCWAVQLTGGGSIGFSTAAQGLYQFPGQDISPSIDPNDHILYVNGVSAGVTGSNVLGNTVVFAINGADFDPPKVWVWNSTDNQWNNAAIGAQNPVSNVGGYNLTLAASTVYHPHFFGYANGNAATLVDMPFSLSGYTAPA